MKLALTFDDGPSRWTEELLDVLAQGNARATFFVIGEHAAQRPELLERTRSEGHETGNHTYSHPKLSMIPDDEIKRELDRGGAAIARALGATPTTFRAPYLDIDDRVQLVAANLGLQHIGCDVVPRDWEPGTSAETIADRVLGGVHDGAVVLLHDGKESVANETVDRRPTIDAVRLLLPALRERGYELVTVSELFSAAT